MASGPRSDRRVAHHNWRMTRRRLTRTAAILLTGILGGYFGYVGWEGSGQLAHPPNPNRDCRTPADLGWAYEAINYDIATDDDLRAREPARQECQTFGQGARDEVVTEDGIRLAGWWIPSAAGSPPDGPTVVLVHGYGSSKSAMLDHATFIHDRYHLVLFDLRNGQQSTGAITTQGISEQRDLSAILDWLERTKGPMQVAVLGESMGGHIAAGVAARDDRVDALILTSTHDTLRRAMVARVDNAGHPGELGWPLIWIGTWLRTGENVFAQDPIAAVVDLGDRPLLLIHGGADDDAPPASAEELRRAAEAAGVDVTVRICADADHGKMDEVCPVEYGTWLNEFLERALP